MTLETVTLRNAVPCVTNKSRRSALGKVQRCIFFASSMYNDFQIRVTFLEKQTTNDEFKILSRYYLINPEDRKKLATSKVETENIIYSNGMTGRREKKSQKMIIQKNYDGFKYFSII